MQSEYQNPSSNHQEFTFNSDTIKQRFAFKTLSVVFVQLIATILINIFLFQLMSVVSEEFTNFMTIVSSIGAIICMLTTCSR